MDCWTTQSTWPSLINQQPQKGPDPKTRPLLPTTASLLTHWLALASCRVDRVGRRHRYPANHPGDLWVRQRRRPVRGALNDRRMADPRGSREIGELRQRRVAV